MPSSRAGAAAWHPARLSAREALLFEAGVKLGGVFHQYLGTPVGPRTHRLLARAIESAVGLQPFVRAVRVRIDPAAGGPTGRGRLAYRYLTAPMLRVRVELADGPTRVVATLAWRAELDYPLMRVERASSSPGTAGPRPRSRRLR